MKKEINTELAPKAIGPYSQGIEIKDGKFLFLSGQAAIDPSIGKLITGSIEEETHQVMKNLEAVLKKAELTFDNVVKTTIYCIDLKDFSKINEVYGSYLKTPYPARATVQVAALPLGASVEIEMVARSN